MQSVHVTDQWLAQFGYLRPNALGAKVESADDKSVDGHSYALVRATPQGGQPVELWFDKETGRLARTVQLLTISTRTTRYEDYRQALGFWWPYKITTYERNEATADVIQIEHTEKISAHTADFKKLRPPEDFELPGGKTEVPIEIDGDVIVEAKLNGQGPFAFILDTGGHNILTPAAVTALGLHSVGAGASGGSGAGTVAEQYIHIDRMRIGGLTLRSQPFTVIAFPYDTVERGARPPLAGILGLELFERFAMRLDYHDKTLTFEPLQGYRHHGQGVAVPIFFSDDEPLLVAKIDGLAGDVGLDTGNSGTLIVQGIWAHRHGLRQRMMSGFPSLGFGMGGASSNWANRAEFEIADRRFEHVIAYYTADAKGAFSSRTESGNVGNDILANFTLDFDYGHGQIWFEPVPGPEPRPFGRMGASLIKERAEAFKVVSVAAGSPAADAGLKIGDEVVAIDGIPVKQLSGWDYRRAVRRPPGTQLTFQIVRSGDTQTVVLTLKELLP